MEELNDLTENLARTAYYFISKYEFSIEDVAELVDAFKAFASEYSDLQIAGKIPKEYVFRKNPDKATAFYEKTIAEFKAELNEVVGGYNK